jgi:hypothetical protein
MLLNADGHNDVLIRVFAYDVRAAIVRAKKDVGLPQSTLDTFHWREYGWYYI